MLAAGTDTPVLLCTRTSQQLASNTCCQLPAFRCHLILEGIHAGLSTSSTGVTAFF